MSSWSAAGPSGRQAPALSYAATTGAGQSGSQQQCGVHVAFKSLQMQPACTLTLALGLLGTRLQSTG